MKAATSRLIKTLRIGSYVFLAILSFAVYTSGSRLISIGDGSTSTITCSSGATYSFQQAGIDASSYGPYLTALTSQDNAAATALCPSSDKTEYNINYAQRHVSNTALKDSVMILGAGLIVIEVLSLALRFIIFGDMSSSKKAI